MTSCFFLCCRASLQICRITRGSEPPSLSLLHPECAADPLSIGPTFKLYRIAILVLGIVGFAACADRARCVYGSGYTAVRAKLEYSAFFFVLGCWNLLSVVDHCFWVHDSPKSRVVVWFDAYTSAASAVCLALGAVAEITSSLKFRVFQRKYKVIWLAGCLGLLAVVLAGSAGAGNGVLQVVWFLVILAGVGVFVAMQILQIRKRLHWKFLVLFCLVGATEFAALLCLFAWGAGLCKAISRHFGGEEVFFLLNAVAVWCFYFFYAAVKGVEAKKLQTITTNAGEQVTVIRAKEGEM